jgi:hypothetical protein
MLRDNDDYRYGFFPLSIHPSSLLPRQDRNQGRQSSACISSVSSRWVQPVFVRVVVIAVFFPTIAHVLYVLLFLYVVVMVRSLSNDQDARGATSLVAVVRSDERLQCVGKRGKATLLRCSIPSMWMPRRSFD